MRVPSAVFCLLNLENRTIFAISHRQHTEACPLPDYSLGISFIRRVKKTASGLVENQLSNKVQRASRWLIYVLLYLENNNSFAISNRQRTDECPLPDLSLGISFLRRVKVTASGLVENQLR